MPNPALTILTYTLRRVDTQSFGNRDISILEPPVGSSGQEGITEAGGEGVPGHGRTVEGDRYWFDYYKKASLLVSGG